jgi:hypothetical protein
MTASALGSLQPCCHCLQEQQQQQEQTPVLAVSLNMRQRTGPQQLLPLLLLHRVAPAS